VRLRAIRSASTAGGPLERQQAVGPAATKLGFDGGKTIVDDYVREFRPLFLKLRSHQRTISRPGVVVLGSMWGSLERHWRERRQGWRDVLPLIAQLSRLAAQLWLHRFSQKRTLELCQSRVF
jgi:hypothetical protein